MKFLFLLTAITSGLLAHEGHSDHPDPATAEMTTAASLFLASLDDDQAKRARFEFKNQERENWHYVPMNDRKGIRLDSLKPHQQHLAFGLLGSGLTQKGLMTATQIMTLEEVLRSRGGDPEVRNTQKYSLAFFGEPSLKEAWAWRFEGHHLSLNFSLVGNQIIGSPAFFGTNPAELRQGPLRGLRPLGEIEDAARALALSLVADGLLPVFSEKPPREILSAQDSKAEAQETQGALSKNFTSTRVKELLALIDLVAAFQRREITNETRRKIHSIQRKKIHFAWGGSLKRGQAHYFRIQGVDFLIEYANTQNDANHAHLVWRDLKNDFARRSLKVHYAEEHQ